MRLRELFEDTNNQVTFVFGRLNPPTIGHKQLLDTAAKQGGDYKIFVSQSQDPKKNPLDYDTKIKFIKAMFPEHAGNVVQDSGLNTVVKVASWLYDQGYRKATFVAGSDRLEDMKKLLDQYNGVEGKAHGFYKFDQLNFVSSGEREDGAEGVAGISASGARMAAANNDFEAFQAATGAGKLAKQLFDAVREGMGVNKAVSTDKKTKELAEAQLNEALPLLLPALATAARVGAPAIARLAGRGAAGAAKVAARNPKTTAAVGAAAANPEITADVIDAARKTYNLISDPGAAAAAMARGAFNSVADAAKQITAMVGNNLSANTINMLATAVMRYGLPVAAVIALLYGGKKLYDYLSSKEKNKNIKEADVAPSPEDILYRKQIKNIIKAEIEKTLNPLEKEALMLWLDGANFVQIGQQISRSVSYSRVIVFKALGKLKRSVKIKRLKNSGLDAFNTREDAAGVGIITKQNTTGDVNKGSIRKNLKAFNL